MLMLEIIQNLYEKKLLTYPRTDAKVLSTAIAKEITKNLNGLAKGNYSVTIIFEGNDKLMNSSLDINLEIKEKVTEVQKTASSSTSSSSSSSSGNSIGPAVDSGGVTREQAQQYGWTYTSEHGGHYIGVNDRWDENAGVYHD